MDRYGHTTRTGKRPAASEWEQPQEEQHDPDATASSTAKKPRVPALASVIVEALKLDSLQKLCSGLEPLLRRIVSEEVERALTRLDCAKLSGRSSPQRIEVPGGRKLQLHFRSRLPPHLFTGGKVEGEKGTSIHVVLLDANRGTVVSSGPESMAKLHVVVLEGDFSDESDENWTEEHFENYEVKEREGKRPLLTGELQVILKEGIGTLGDLTFTDNSSWIRSRKFRLGVKVADGFCYGLRIREAKTDAFAVKDHRGELYKKHYPPALHDEVWRLDRIAKDGALHKKLVNARISTVEDFLRLLVREPQKLRSILGSGMSNKMWDNTVEHAKTCALGGKLYIYYADQTQATGAVFNDIYELRGLISAGQFLPVEALVHNQKVLVDMLVKRAYDDWNHVVEYDGKALMNSLNNSQKAQFLPPVTDDDAQTDQYFMPARQTQSFCSSELGTHAQTERTYKPYSPPELALATPQAYPSIYPSGDWPNTRDELGSMDFFSEEEIRARSSEILEHDDMQQLLRSFPAGSPYYGYHSGHLEPHGQCEFGQGRNPHNAKASVSWLKLKAAFRWGIFVRKKSAQRRAHLVELD